MHGIKDQREAKVAGMTNHRVIRRQPHISLNEYFAAIMRYDYVWNKINSIGYYCASRVKIL